MAGAYISKPGAQRNPNHRTLDVPAHRSARKPRQIIRHDAEAYRLFAKELITADELMARITVAK